MVGSAWMPWVRPTIGVSRNSRAALGDRVLELGRGTRDQVDGPRHLQRERGVDDVARRQAVVHPRAGRRTDLLLHDVDERGDVVVGDLLALVDRVDVEARALAHRPGVGFGHHAEARPRFDREDLDLEPRAETRLVGEQRGDLGERVARDHGRAWEPMSRR